MILTRLFLTLGLCFGLYQALRPLREPLHGNHQTECRENDDEPSEMSPKNLRFNASGKDARKERGDESSKSREDREG